MKILYFTDDYTFDIFGTKRSIFEEVKSRGHDIIWIDRKEIGRALALVEEHRPDQVWLSHSNLALPPGAKEAITVPVVGFGFSDPYYFTEDRFDSYDAYVTNYRAFTDKYKGRIPLHYNATACDFRFHKDVGADKYIDISVIGRGTHPRFSNPNERVKVVRRLREDGFTVHTFGDEWGDHPDDHEFISGEVFREVINASKIGLDIQDVASPLAHRMFEYAACCVPSITRRRDEAMRMFGEGTEILAYDTYDQIRDQLARFFSNGRAGAGDELRAIGERARLRCEAEHNISHRIDRLIPFVQALSRFTGKTTFAVPEAVGVGAPAGTAQETSSARESGSLDALQRVADRLSAAVAPASTQTRPATEAPSGAGVAIHPVSAYVNYEAVAEVLRRAKVTSILDVGGTGKLAKLTQIPVTDANIARGIDGCSLPYETGAFDATVSIATLEHVQDAIRFLDESVRVCRKVSVHWFPFGVHAEKVEAFKAQLGHGHECTVPDLARILQHAGDLGVTYTYRPLLTISEHLLLLATVNPALNTPTLFDYVGIHGHNPYGALLTLIKSF